MYHIGSNVLCILYIVLCRYDVLFKVGSTGGGRPQAQHRLAPFERRQGPDEAEGVLVAEGGDLHGEGEAWPQARTQLRLVHNHDEFVRHYLKLTQMSCQLMMERRQYNYTRIHITIHHSEVG